MSKKQFSYEVFKASFLTQVFDDCINRGQKHGFSIEMISASLYEDFRYLGNSYAKNRFQSQKGPFDEVVKYFMLEVICAAWFSGYFKGNLNGHKSEAKKIIREYGLTNLYDRIDDGQKNSRGFTDREQIERDLCSLGIINSSV